MKSVKSLLLLTLVISSIVGFSQAVLQPGTQHSHTNSLVSPGCGSYELLKYKDQVDPGYMNMSNQMVQQIATIANKQGNRTKSSTPYVIPVVFHIVHENAAENLPDSVILNQLQVLNECFRRQNSDTSNTRAPFSSLVGDAQIEFALATLDPNNNPTTGITRTQTNVTHFGGTLPYGPGQNAQISRWVNDSLFPNYFRLADSSAGGINPWDTTRYLNVWIGDLRLFEPLFNNFEELIFFAFATPPSNHPNFPSNPQLTEQGVFMHYVNVGANNPNSFPAPYGVYNGLVTTGKMLVHEVGHYLGLRHIWGDGDCTADDFIFDTPRADAASQFNCTPAANTCLDTINGIDLPNMIENYMDYSSANCQNSFTIGQINLMRQVISTYRPTLPVVTFLAESKILNNVSVYPNPTNGILNISITELTNVSLTIRDLSGRIVYEQINLPKGNLQVELNHSAGIYFATFETERKRETIKLIKQ